MKIFIQVKSRATCALRLCLVLTSVLATQAGCTSGAKSPTQSHVQVMREEAKKSRDPELSAQWLLAELVSPGGSSTTARDARKHLDALGKDGLYVSLARGLDDSAHGRLTSSVEHYLTAVKHARDSDDPKAPLIAWFAMSQALDHSHLVEDLYGRWEKFVTAAIDQPKGIGWRARAQLLDWWGNEAWEKAEADIEDEYAKRAGCLGNVRLAGPFGRNATADVARSFPAERPGPWPARWAGEATMPAEPEVVEVERFGCETSAKKAGYSGIYYGESYIALDEPTSLILATPGALGTWVNDHAVQERDLRQWGAWLDYGVRVELPAGRHRLLVKLSEPSAAIRVMHPDGRPFAVESSSDPAGGYSLVPPRVLGDPDILAGYVRRGNVVETKSDAERFLAATLIREEGQPDVAAVLLEPLVKKPESATGLALTAAADITETDPIYDATHTRDLMRELYHRAAKKDPGLWRARLSVALWEAERGGAVAGVKPMRELVAAFPDVPALHLALARVYGELGWATEYKQTVLGMTERFPNSLEALHAAIEIHDERGETKRVEELVKRVMTIDPDSELILERALGRHDYQVALVELERLKKRRPERKDIAERIHDILVRTGKESETFKKLKAAIEQNPRNTQARLELADAKFASGQKDAVRRALADATQAGAPTGALEEALDLLEGMNALEPYRLNGRAIIDAYEKAGREMEGTAARVLDYAAVWVHADGSSRMLEHQVIRVQSAEAINRFAELPPLSGLPLHMRVIKRDGRVLEPEFVSGKPTLTMPHLEVGDYIETEHVVSLGGDGRQGKSYVSPHWFFREANIAYARSEFVMITPSHKEAELTIETRNNVPKPTLDPQGPITVRRWRVDFSPAAPVEPNSAPMQEFLPSVVLGWGVSQEERLETFNDSIADLTPVDPRISRIARRIVEPMGPEDPTRRAAKLYRWILDNVEEGEESDGRRVVISKNGNRWRGFLTLCRALGIDAHFAVAKNRLATPPAGPLSRADVFTVPLLRLEGRQRPVWLTVNSKYAPFGYVPAEVRGMPAFVLDGENPPKPATVPAGGELDKLDVSGKVRLASDGSANVDIALSFHGKYATQLRAGLAQVPEHQLHDILEARVLGAALQGARLDSYDIKRASDLDAPLSIRMKGQVPHFAQKSGGMLLVSPPFSPKVSGLATLASRQTPLLIDEATHHHVALDIVLPKGAAVVSTLGQREFRDGERAVDIADQVKGSKIVLERTVKLVAGRVQPNDYGKFVRFARQSDDALSASIRIRP